MLRLLPAETSLIDSQCDQHFEKVCIVPKNNFEYSALNTRKVADHTSCGRACTSGNSIIPIPLFIHDFGGDLRRKMASIGPWQLVLLGGVALLE